MIYKLSNYFIEVLYKLVLFIKKTIINIFWVLCNSLTHNKLFKTKSRYSSNVNIVCNCGFFCFRINKNFVK